MPRSKSPEVTEFKSSGVREPINSSTRELLNIPPSPEYCAFAARATLERLVKLKAEIEGVKHGRDIEHVHRMRVASRRVRTTLRMFGACFPRKSLKVWKHEVRAVTQALGAARDLDVQIAFVRSHRDRESKIQNLRSKITRPGLNRLLLRLKQKREKQQSQVISRIEELQDCGVVENMEALLAPVLAQATNAKPPADLISAAQDWIRRGLSELLEYEPFVAKPKAIKELHAMRIAAKHLRYTLEVFEPLFAHNRGQGTGIGDQESVPDTRHPTPDTYLLSLEAAKQIQTLLGDLHDCDVWLELIPAFLAKEEDRCRKFHGHERAFRRLRPGIEHFRLSVRRQRARTYLRFNTYWQQTSRRRIWDAVRRMTEEVGP